MQNSAASCFIVSLIDLAAAAGVGTFAIIQKQVSACMVTGVLYCMAGRLSGSFHNDLAARDVISAGNGNPFNSNWVSIFSAF